MNEVQLFAAGGERLLLSLFAHNYAAPTVETERVFSADGLILTQLRTNLSDISLE